MNNGDSRGPEFFSGELEFCSVCGSILPLADATKFVVCRLCSTSIPIGNFHGMETKSVVVSILSS